MIAIKSDAMKQMPEYCDDCVWYGSRPHPHKGWTELCELMGHCIDDDQEEEWIYDGNGRPKACPLIEVADTPQTEVGYCNECRWFKDKQVCGRCRSRNLFAKADTPQTDVYDYKGNGKWERSE